ncbi:MAG: hypothetical protein KTR32_41480 [Granulosicoccus sp.]|nr:hypothetical protein [Granulosicoccus sp.]
MTPETQSVQCDVPTHVSGSSNDPVDGDSASMLAFTFLLKAYELSTPESDDSVPIWDVGSALGLEEVTAESIASDLQDMNLVYYSSLAGDIALTSFGVSEIVLARSLPHQATTHFPPLASMSEQMMLPLANQSSISNTADFSENVSRLVGQLETFKVELQGQKSAVSLDESIQRLEFTLNETGEWSDVLIRELEEIQLELTIPDQK